MSGRAGRRGTPVHLHERVSACSSVPVAALREGIRTVLVRLRTSRGLGPRGRSPMARLCSEVEFEAAPKWCSANTNCAASSCRTDGGVVVDLRGRRRVVARRVVHAGVPGRVLIEIELEPEAARRDRPRGVHTLCQPREVQVGHRFVVRKRHSPVPQNGRRGTLFIVPSRRVVWCAGCCEVLPRPELPVRCRDPNPDLRCRPRWCRW